MASQVCETLSTFINGDEEVMEINGDLLMSLMEEIESPCDDESDDDDRLDSLIRSFEAEISRSNNMDDDHHDDSASTGSELMVCNGEDHTQSWNVGQMDGQDCLAASSCDFEAGWVEMELTAGDGSWCIDPFADEIHGITGESFGVRNINWKVYERFAMGEQGYNSFWQDSYNLVE